MGDRLGLRPGCSKQTPLPEGKASAASFTDVGMSGTATGLIAVATFRSLRLMRSLRRAPRLSLSVGGEAFMPRFGMLDSGICIGTEGNAGWSDSAGPVGGGASIPSVPRSCLDVLDELSGWLRGRM